MWVMTHWKKKKTEKEREWEVREEGGNPGKGTNNGCASQL